MIAVSQPSGNQDQEQNRSDHENRPDRTQRLFSAGKKMDQEGGHDDVHLHAIERSDVEL